MSDPSRPLEVAVGVVYDGAGRVLVNQRQADKSFAGQWELPGGKIEAGETTSEALARELAEELGIAVRQQRPLIAVSHRYETLAVRLNVNEVLAYRGTPHGREAQALQWIEPASLHELDLLAADTAIVKAIVLPRVCLITDAQRFGVERTLELLERHLQVARLMLIVREKQMDRRRLRAFTDRATALCRARGSLVIVHADCDFADYERVDGAHLSARGLEQRQVPHAPGFIGASCHSSVEIRRAREAGADYILLSPVKRTGSHPDAPPLGWPRFAGLCSAAAMPVYALGGMQLRDLDTAIEHGAQGVALLGAAWQPEL